MATLWKCVVEPTSYAIRLCFEVGYGQGHHLSNVKYRDARGAEDRGAEGVEQHGERGGGIPLRSRLRGSGGAP